jgi:hypothetical protein
MNRIDPPSWFGEIRIDSSGVTEAEYASIQRHRGEMLATVQDEVEAYVDDPTLVFDGDEAGFPHRRRMTGTYYIARESYAAHCDPAWFQIGVVCHCLEVPKPGMDRDDDYLGLEVWLRCEPSELSRFSVFRNTDSSSI